MLLKDKGFIKVFLSLAIPMALQELLTLSVGLMDSLMVGSLGETQLSAVTLGNQPAFLLTFVIFGVGGGSSALISQYWGKGDTFTIGRITAFAMKLAMIIAAAFSIIVVFFPENVMSLLTNDAEVIRQGSEYISIVGKVYVLQAFTGTFITCVKAVERVKITVVLYSISFCVNVFFNYVFIFGKFGAPQMNVAGAGVGTFIARVVEVIIVLIYICKFEDRICLKLPYFFKTGKILRHDFFKYASPVIFNECTWAAGIVVQASIMGRLGVEAVAAVSIINTLQQVLMTLVYGTAGAALVIVGKRIGQKKYDWARQSAFASIMLTLIVCIVAAVALLLLKPAFLSLYSMTDKTYELVNIIIFISAAIVIVQGINTTSVVGVFRGGGDTKFGMICDLICMWCVAVPLGMFMGIYAGAAVPLVFFCIKIDEFVKCPIYLQHVKSLKWLKNITREDI